MKKHLPTLILLSFLMLSLLTFVSPYTAVAHVSPYTAVAQDDELVILSPASESETVLIADKFADYYLAKTGRTVSVTYSVAGTSECVRRVIESEGSPKWDVLLTGGLEVYIELEGFGLLQSFCNPDDPDWVAINATVPDTLFGQFPAKDTTPENGMYNWWPTCMAGYGIIYNKEYFETHDIPIPKDWEDLTDPIYSGLITMSPPSRSGSNHAMMEIILHSYGWKVGWGIIKKIGANVAEFSLSSGGVVPFVEHGTYPISFVWDGYAVQLAMREAPVEFFYPPRDEVEKHTIMLPDCVAILAGAPHPDVAYYWMKFMVSDEGQKLWLGTRLPFLKSVYEEAPAGYPNPYEMEMQTIEYNEELVATRWDVINGLFDNIIVAPQDKLRTVWGTIQEANTSINEAAAEGHDVSMARSALDEALNTMTSMPVDEAWAEANGAQYATDSEFSDARNAEWTAFAIKKYDDALSAAVTASYVWASEAIKAEQRTAESNLYIGLGGGFLLGAGIGGVAVYYRSKKKYEE